MTVKTRLLDVQMVASRLSVGVSTVYRLIKTGQLEHLKIGPKKGIRIPEISVVRAERYGFDATQEDD